MGIVGGHPESGMRIEVERALEGGPPWGYRGEAVTPHARFPVTAVVSAAGEVAVDMAGDAPVGLADKVRLLVRSVFKHAQGESSPPPRRIVRWRAEF
jgi:hypothetical protein